MTKVKSGIECSYLDLRRQILSVSECIQFHLHSYIQYYDTRIKGEGGVRQDDGSGPIPQQSACAPSIRR